MSVVIGFTIMLMLGFAGYMAYRLFLKRTLSVLICLCLEVIALTVALVAFVLNVQTSNLSEILYIAFGILVPSAFFLYDYRKMMEKIRDQGVSEGLLGRKKNRLANSDEPIYSTQSATAGQQAGFDGDIFSQMESISPTDYKGYYSLGLSYYQMGLKEEAVDCFKRAIEIKPDSYEAYFNMAVAMDEIGEQEEAIRALKKVISLKSDFIDAYNNLGIIFSTQGKHNEALYVYAKGLEMNPQEYSLFYNMGITLSETGRFPEAVEAYKKALERKPDEYEISYHLGAALAQLRRYDEAIEAYKSALRIKPTDSELFYNLSVVYSLLRKQDIAMDNLKKAIEINSDLKVEAKRNKAFEFIKTNPEFKRLIF